MLSLESLSRDHDRAGFDCGSEPLNKFLRETARQHLDRGISRAFVLVDESEPPPKPISGYFSITMCQCQSDSLPPTMAKGLPREVCGVKLARLGVAKSLQGNRLGTRLLMAAMEKTLEIFESAGGIGLFVNAKDSKAQVFYEQFGFVSLQTDVLELFLPMASIRRLVQEY